MRVVVMGVAGSGKSTVAQMLARELDAVYLDADDFHPATNVAKMAAGIPLDDDDRWPWLARLRAALRARPRVVLACSALRRGYRDVLRGAEDVQFLFLDIDQALATARLDARPGHFMTASMVASQFAALERPDRESGVVVADASMGVDVLVPAAAEFLVAGRTARGPAPLFAAGGPAAELDGEALAEIVQRISASVIARGARRVLLVPPDHTRLHSRAGEITVALRDQLSAASVEVAVLPALGTHAPMSATDASALFGPSLPSAELLRHDWRDGVRVVGVLSPEEVDACTGGRVRDAIEIAVDEHLFAGWDLVVSIGQVVPHEVIGMANFTKNLVIGLGGAPTIHRTHYVGAICGMESIMGRTSTVVRDLVDAAFDRFLAPAVSAMWVLTVVEDTGGSTSLRGVFVGEGRTSESGGAAYRAAAELAREVNLEIVDEPFERAVCWLDPREFHSTWLGNKAIYRTRMAMADGGELVVLAPGVRRFGEDERIDGLIRRHGYRGTAASLQAATADVELAANPSAIAHLVHGSSEGRFRIVYCTDADGGGLTRDEVESVGYEWRPLEDELVRLGHSSTWSTGHHLDVDGVPLMYISNPALGLWSIGGRGVGSAQEEGSS